MEIKKVLVKSDIHDDKDKRKAMKSVSSLRGIDSVEVDMKKSNMTVIGEVDPVDVVRKLKKHWCARIESVGPPKEEKKDEKEDDKTIAEFLRLHRAYNPPYTIVTNQ